MRALICGLVGAVAAGIPAAQGQDFISPTALFDRISGYETIAVTSTPPGVAPQTLWSAQPEFDPLRPLVTQVSHETATSLYGETCQASTCEPARGCNACDSWCQPMVPNMIGDGGLLQPLDPQFGLGTMLGLPASHAAKIAENNSPLPRTRVAFGYNFLGRAETGQIGSQDDKSDLQEYRFTYEQLVYSNRLSLELLIPFYHTTEYNVIDASGGANFYPLNTEFGDVAFGFKGLLVDAENWKLSTGLRIEAPTTDEYQTGNPLNQIIRDDVWHFTPYVGLLVNPGNTWFLQAFGSYRLNSDDLVSSGPFLPTEGIREPTYLMIDVSLGHWLYTNPEARMLKAFVPTLELHYTTTTEPYQHIPSTNLWNDTSYGHTDFLNLTLGSTAYVGQNLTIANGLVLPLRTNSNTTVFFDGPTDRSFDWAYMFNVNYYFGR